MLMMCLRLGNEMYDVMITKRFHYRGGFFLNKIKSKQLFARYRVQEGGPRPGVQSGQLTDLKGERTTPSLLHAGTG